MATGNAVSRTRQIVMLAAAAMAAAPAMAQVVIPPSVDPGAIQRRQMEEEERRRQEERERLKPTAPIDQKALARPAPRPVDSTVKFLVRDITFSRSRILPKDLLEKVAAPYRGRELSLADLQQLADRINEVYKVRHFVTAEALIPPQDVTKGVVHVRLVEGRVGRTTIEGNASTSTSFIEERLRLKPGALVNLDTLESAMIRFNRLYDAQLRAALRPGAATGTTDFQIDVQEPRRNNVRMTLDNLGSPATGRTRLTAAYLRHSVFGHRDDFTVSDTVSQGDNSSAVNYGVPVNTWGGRVDVGFNFDKTSIKNGGLGTLGITGESKALTATLRQPTWLTRRLELDFILGFQKRDTTNWIDTQFLNDTKTRSESLGAEFQVFGDRNYEFASWTRSYCTATVLTPVLLIIDRGSLRYNHDFGGGYTFNSSFTWQEGPIKPLPSSEQFFIGGDGSVVGYTVAVASGYSGGVLDLDLHHPLATFHSFSQQVVTTGVFSVDYGTVTPYLPPGSTLVAHQHLDGIGWGVNAAIGSRYNARVSYGYGFGGTQNMRDKILLFQLSATVF